MKKVKSILIIASICLITGVSSAESNIYSGETVEKRLSRIEKDLRILNKEVYQNGVSPLSSDARKDEAKVQLADFEIRLSSLEEKIRQMTGDIETINHQQNKILEQISKVQEDVDFRFNAIETAQESAKAAQAEVIAQVKTQQAKLKEPKVDLSAFQKAKEDVVQTVDSKAKPLELLRGTNGSVEEQYKSAFELLKDKKYEEAEKAFSQFISENKDHKLAGNAQYWLAETYYVRGDIEEAMKQFAIGYKNYKDSLKATDNLLKLAITLGALDRKDDACLTLDELESNYQPLSKNIEARMKNEKIKYKCSEL